MKAKSSSKLVEHIRKSNDSLNVASVASEFLQPVEESTGNHFPVTASIVPITSNVDNCAGKMNHILGSSNADEDRVSQCG
jgi:hypothetical protein